MGLPHALVDRARRVFAREDPASPWREGQPEGEVATGPWFACRLRPMTRSEQTPGGHSGYSYVDEQARLLIGPYDESGAALIDADDPAAFLDADDMVEVESELGLHRWYVSGAPRPLRRRRGVAGYTVEIRRAREAEVEEGVLAVPPQLSEPRQLVHPQGAGSLPRVSDEWEFEGG